MTGAFPKADIHPAIRDPRSTDRFSQTRKRTRHDAHLAVEGKRDPDHERVALTDKTC